MDENLSPVSAIEAIEKAPNRIQGMVRSIEQYRNGDPKAVAAGSHAQVLFALQDMRHDILVLWDFAVEAASQAEALQQEVDSLKQTRQHSREASAALHDAFMEERKRVEALQRENAEKDARIAALEAGMRPFSKFAGVVFERNFNSSDPVDTMTATDGAVSTLYARDFFGARALLGGENAE